jgi:hypothetical protein
MAPPPARYSRRIRIAGTSGITSWGPLIEEGTSKMSAATTLRATGKLDGHA